MVEPILAHYGETGISAAGETLVVHAWRGGGPPYLHVHHADDEAWHVLEGTLRFRFGECVVDAPAGTTVFVPAGVAHTYDETGGPARYLMILTPRLERLIAALHTAPSEQHADIMGAHESEILD
jgi:mannose-6-phosphate isomerase-like protein (cupin superfamily)